MNQVGESQFIRIEKCESDAVWIASINNPPANLLSAVILNELTKSMLDFQKEPQAKVMILTGAGERAFSAGADIHEIMSIDSPEKGVELARKGQELCHQIEKSDKPVIAAIHALCLGGGNEIALACHIRIASERAKFGQPEITIGIIPGFGGTQRLPRLIGESRARKLILTGDMISAAEAYELGLVDEVVKAGFAVERALEIARKILRNSQKVVCLAQTAIREGLELPLDRGLAKELDCFRDVCKSEDMREGLIAYKERRLAKYKDC